MSAKVSRVVLMLLFAASVACKAQIANSGNTFNNNNLGNGMGNNTGNPVLLVPRVMPVAGYYGTGIRGVTVRTPTAYRQAVARSFFVSGGIRLGSPVANAQMNNNPPNQAGFPTRIR